MIVLNTTPQLVMTKTEWFEYLTDEDLNVTGTYESMIMYCPECKNFYNQKACGNRSVLHFDTIYHPTDGNIVIAELLGPDKYQKRIDNIKCNARPHRVTSVKDLNYCIEHHNS